MVDRNIQITVTTNAEEQLGRLTRGLRDTERQMLSTQATARTTGRALAIAPPAATRQLVAYNSALAGANRTLLTFGRAQRLLIANQGNRNFLAGIGAGLQEIERSQAAANLARISGALGTAVGSTLRLGAATAGLGLLVAAGTVVRYTASYIGLRRELGTVITNNAELLAAQREITAEAARTGDSIDDVTQRFIEQEVAQGALIDRTTDTERAFNTLEAGVLGLFGELDNLLQISPRIGNFFGGITDELEEFGRSLLDTGSRIGRFTERVRGLINTARQLNAANPTALGSALVSAGDALFGVQGANEAEAEAAIRLAPSGGRGERRPQTLTEIEDERRAQEERTRLQEREEARAQTERERNQREAERAAREERQQQLDIANAAARAEQQRAQEIREGADAEFEEQAALDQSRLQAATEAARQIETLEEERIRRITELQRIFDEAAATSLRLNQEQVFSLEQLREAENSVRQDIERRQEIQEQANRSDSAVNLARDLDRISRSGQASLSQFFQTLGDGFSGGEDAVRSFGRTAQRVLADIAAREATVGIIRLFAGSTSSTAATTSQLSAITGPAGQVGTSFQVGGSGGADSRLVSLMATPGEQVTVETPEQRTRRLNGSDRGGMPEFRITNINLTDRRALLSELSTAQGDVTLIQGIQRNAESIRAVLDAR